MANIISRAAGAIASLFGRGGGKGSRIASQNRAAKLGKSAANRKGCPTAGDGQEGRWPNGRQGIQRRGRRLVGGGAVVRRGWSLAEGGWRESAPRATNRGTPDPAIRTRMGDH